jgi:hypothetical protein
MTAMFQVYSTTNFGNYSYLITSFKSGSVCSADYGSVTNADYGSICSAFLNLNSNEQIVILKESKEIRFDKKLDLYITGQKRKQEILDFIKKEKKEKKKLNDLEIENQRQIEQLNDFIKLKISFYQEIIFNELYFHKMEIESGLIYNKVLEALNKVDFGSFWSASECLDAKKKAIFVFNLLIEMYLLK